jgi:hypothetical protein
MTKAEKYQLIAENVPKVFEAGKAQSGGSDNVQWWTDFVNGCQTAGTWEQAFSGAGFNDKTFNLPFDIKPNTAATMFYRTGITDLKSLVEKLGITIDFSSATSANSTFNLSKVTRLPKLDFRKATNVASTFGSCTALISIEEFSVSRAITNSFTGCTALEEIRIGSNLVASFNIADCVKLSAQSIDSILSHLGGSANCTLTLPSVAPTTYDAEYGAGSFEEKVSLKRSNWTIAY